MSAPSADRNLLFGILAMQMDFISRDALVAAMNAWVLEKATPLGEILLRQGALRGERHVLLEALVREHLQTHGDDPHKSLASVSSGSSIRQSLQQIADADVSASLSHLTPARPDELAGTLLTAVGAPTSGGTRFRILREHAEGGLGKVFVARDAELNRDVALKEIRNRHADEPDRRARFVLEAEITGGLEHPGIVPVYGLGQYADGRPYYAMRFIKGDSLHDAIQRFHKGDEAGRDTSERALSLRQLLGRFVDVCDAIAYAHSRGVLHRDLKPQNVMLGPYGETLVVDWGLAKARGKSLSDSNSDAPLRPLAVEGSTPTLLGSALGTPAFMPPEQAVGRHDELGPTSDVYGLGATLYNLLTGQPPFTNTSHVGDVLLRVQRGDFPRLREVKPNVPTALEAVCLKAMALSPAERYASPRELADDVERWLADEPVRAWREPWRVRAGRWMRRHRALMAALAAALFVTLLAAGYGAWYVDRQRTEQRRGVEAALADVTRLQSEARWTEARAVLTQARDRLGEDGPRDLHTRLERAQRNLDLVATLDAIRLKKATIVDGRFDFRGADRDYEIAFRQAGMEDVGGDAGQAAGWVKSSDIRDALVAALDDWAVTTETPQRRAWLLGISRRVDPDPWRDRARDADLWNDVEALQRLTAEQPIRSQSPQLRAALATRLRNLNGNAVKLLEVARAVHPNDFWVHFLLGSAFAKQKNYAEAVASYRTALALRPETYAVYVNLSDALLKKGEVDEALAVCRQALEREPNDASGYVNLGVIFRKKGLADEALAAFRKAIELDPTDPLPYYNLGTVLHDTGKVDDALRAYRQALERDPNYAKAYNNLGLALQEKGQWDNALAAYRKAIELDPRDAPAYSNLGSALHDKGRVDEAIAALRKAVEIDPNLALAHGALGEALLGKGLFQEALTSTQRCLQLLPVVHPLRSFARQQLQQCERLAALDKKLSAIHKGEAKPTDAAEQLSLARFCSRTKRHAAAARFFADTFAAQPKLGDDLTAQNRYNAACAAALAAAGQGTDANKLDDKQRARLRQQARDWLRADLELWRKPLTKGTPQEREAAKKTLRHWQQDSDLAGVRETTKLPDAERAEWSKLWDEVAELLKK